MFSLVRASSRQSFFKTAPASLIVPKPVLITAGLIGPKDMDPFQGQVLLTQNGINFFAYSQDWNKIEVATEQYDLPNTITNPLTMLVPRHSFKGVLLVIKMIDTNVRTLPSDLQNKSFDDPELKRRHILLGNEVDAYFSGHPEELNAFMSLLKASIDQLHQELPGIKVGTITTFDSLNNPELFQTLTEHSDFINYTYYPINGLSGGNLAKGWQMRPLSEIPADLLRMSVSAGLKPFAFTEIGYSASPVNNSSEDTQSNFVKAVFDTLENDRIKSRIEFISWSSFADYGTDFCSGYASDQGVEDSPEFCAFLENLGLRTHANNLPRKSWATFVEKVRQWTK